MVGRKENKVNSSFIDKIVDFAFSNDSRKWLILIFLLGAILRFVVVSNLGPVADEVVHGSHAIGVANLRPLSTITQGPIWFYLTDFAYNTFGVHLFSARFLSFLFGSLTIFLVYIICKELFNKKAGLFASFLFAVSPYHISWAAAYMDQTLMFFVLLSAYFLITEYKKSGKISLISALFMGIAMLVKIIAAVFGLAFGVFMLIILYNNYKKDIKLFKENIKRVFIYLLIMLLCFTPVFSYNYFLYKDKNIVDLPFAMYFGISKEAYQGPGLAHGEGFSLSKLPGRFVDLINYYFLKEDLFNFLFGLLGITFFFVSKDGKDISKWFIILLIVIPIPVIVAALLLQTHYTSFVSLFAIFGGYALMKISNYSKNFKINNLLSILLLILFIFSIFSLWQSLSSQSAVEKMRSYTINKIDKNSVIIVDPRIYRGFTAWIFNDRHYIDMSQFYQLINAIPPQNEKQVTVHTYFIECVPDDCGWGTIQNQPELNQTVEDFIKNFEQVKSENIIGGGNIKGVREGETIGTPYFRIYDTMIVVNPDILTYIDKTHNFFFYDIPRDRNPSQAFDYYNLNGGGDSLLNMLAYLILYILILISILSIPSVIYILFKENEKMG